METDIIGVTIGVLGIVIGVVVSYYFYRKSIRIKEPVYSMRSNNLISGSVSTLENLNITYKDYKVENLTVSKILFYNRGSETITRQDIETKNRLSISSETCKILDASILQVNNNSNSLEIGYNPLNKNILINFDYLDKNQGVVIQVVHTGLSSENLNMGGDIRGVQKIVYIQSEMLQTIEQRRITRIAFPTLVLALVLLGLGMILTILGVSEEITFVIALSTFMLYAIAAGVVRFAGLWRKGVTQDYVIPHGLEKFLE